MFRRITVGNFKRFQNASIKLERLNIIVGPNNSGKSSLVGALRLICQTLDSYDDQVPLLLNGPFGDFGTYKDLIYKNHRGRPLEIQFELDIPSVDFGNSENSVLKIDLVFKYSQEDREVYAQSIKIALDGDHLASAKYSREGQRYNIERLGTLDIPPSLKNYISREFRFRHFFPVPLTQRLGVFESDRRNAYKAFTEDFNSGPNHAVLRKLARIWPRLASAVARSDYLGPLRIAPSRTYLFRGERSKRIGISGENLTSILATKDRKREKSGGLTIQDQINKWLQSAEMGKEAMLVPISDRHFEIRIQNFFTKEDQNIADVGYGHSQVLPFLAGGLALPKNSTYLAEQPELHLHPKAQAELGDYLLRLYKNSVQTVIETHSEHLILRLQQHIAAGSINPEDVCIFYVSNSPEDDKGRPLDEITRIGIDRKGQFTKEWPKGFFPEKLTESKRLAKIRMEQIGLDF